MKILIIDGNSLLYRAYYATQQLAKRQMYTQTTNGVFVALKMLKKLIDQQVNAYKYVFITFDLGKKTLRHQSYKTYKIHRPKTPEALIEQIPVFQTFLETLKIQIFQDHLYEADDLMATLATKISQQNPTSIIDLLSGDRDLLQLVKPTIRILLFKTGVSQLQIIDEKNFTANFAIQPEQIPDYKALIGDKSDNLPGINGIGKKTAEQLLSEYHKLEDIFANTNHLPVKWQNKLLDLEVQQQALKIRQLTILKTDIPLNINWNWQKIDFNSPAMQALYKKYHMKSLLITPVRQKGFDF